MASNLQEFDGERAREVWMEKCQNKGIAAPTRSRLVTLVSESAELRADWASMISHQLPHPADAEAFITRLPEALLWLDALAPAALALPTLAHNAGEAAVTHVRDPQQELVDVRLGVAGFRRQTEIKVLGEPVRLDEAFLEAGSSLENPVC